MALSGGDRDADRLFDVRPCRARGERNGARVHTRFGLQLKERELGGTEGEGLGFLQFDRTGARCERPRRYNSGSEAARGACHFWTSIGTRNTMAVFRDLEREGDLTPRAGHYIEPFMER